MSASYFKSTTPTVKMVYAALLFASFVGLSLCAGGIFPMKEEEIEKSEALKEGMKLAVEKLNMKNERKENDYR